MSESDLHTYLDEMDEINGYPQGCENDALPERLRASAARMRAARRREYPPLSGEHLATVASLLGMRTRTSPNVD